MQGYLSRRHAPAELLAIGRAEVTGYGVEVIEDVVRRIDPGFACSSAPAGRSAHGDAKGVSR